MRPPQDIIRCIILGVIQHASAVSNAQFFPDGTNKIVTASCDCTVKIIEGDSFDSPHDSPHTLTIGDGKVSTVDGAYEGKISPDGRYLAVASPNKTVRLFRIRTSSSGVLETVLLYTWTGHSGEVRASFFSHNSAMVLTTCQDRGNRLWCTETGQVIMKFPQNKTVKDLQLGTGQQLSLNPFSPDDQKVVIVSAENQAQVYDIRTRVRVASLMPEGRATAVWVSFSPVGSATSGYMIAVGYQCRVILWSLGGRGKTSLHQLDTNKPYVSAWSPDGRYLATAKSVRGEGPCKAAATLWDTVTSEAKFQLEGHTDTVVGMQVSPDGRLLATSCKDGKARLFSMTSGDCLCCLEGKGRLTSIAFNNDGTRLVTGSAGAGGKEARVYSIEVTDLGSLMFALDDVGLGHVKAAVLESGLPSLADLGVLEMATIAGRDESTQTNLWGLAQDPDQWLSSRRTLHTALAKLTLPPEERDRLLQACLDQQLFCCDDLVRASKDVLKVLAPELGTRTQLTLLAQSAASRPATVRVGDPTPERPFIFNPCATMAKVRRLTCPL